MIDSIVHDGTMSGHGEPRVAKLLACVSLPIFIIGGASSVNEMLDTTSRNPTVAAAAGILWTIKSKYGAVLIP